MLCYGGFLLGCHGFKDWCFLLLIYFIILFVEREREREREREIGYKVAAVHPSRL